MNKPLLLAAAAAVSLGLAAEASTREQIRIVGSSTVYPFAITAAKDFGSSTSFPTPVIESTGSGGGLKLFCEGVGVGTPDVTNVSRAIKISEIEVGENDNLIVQKLEANPRSLGICGFSFLDQNADKVHGSVIDGVSPTFGNIADGAYPVSRPLFFYVKSAYIGVIPGLAEYIDIFTGDAAASPDGFLADRGLIPLPDAERSEMRSNATALKAIKELQNHEK